MDAGAEEQRREGSKSEHIHTLEGQLKTEVANKASEICRLAREMEDQKVQIEQLQREKNSLNDRLDSVLSVTQKDRVDFNLHRLEVDSFVKQIEAFKINELKLKRQINALKIQLND